MTDDPQRRDPAADAPGGDAEPQTPSSPHPPGEAPPPPQPEDEGQPQRIWDPDAGRWVDPSELQTAPSAMPPAGAAAQAAAAAGPGRPRPVPGWVAPLAAGILGAALAIVAIYLLGGIGSGRTTTPLPRAGADDTVSLVEAVRPSVVSVTVPEEDGDRRAASGFVLRQDGVIVTSASLIDGAESVVATFPDGRAARARVIGADPATDVAVVKVEARGLPVVLRTSAELARLGESVAVIGSPAETFASVTTAVISQIGRPVSDDGRLKLDLIQIDAGGAVTPGSAVVGLDGSALAMATAVRDAAGSRYAVPMDIVSSVARELLAGEPVTHPWIGLVVTEATGRAAGDGAALIVAVVFRDSPAQQAGLQPGDAILSLSGREITGALSLMVAVEQAGVGAELTMSVRPRDGDRRDVTVTVAERPEF